MAPSHSGRPAIRWLCKAAPGAAGLLVGYDFKSGTSIHLRLTLDVAEPNYGGNEQWAWWSTDVAPL